MFPLRFLDAATLEVALVELANPVWSRLTWDLWSKTLMLSRHSATWPSVLLSLKSRGWVGRPHPWTGQEEQGPAQPAHTTWPHTPDTRGKLGPDTATEQTEQDTSDLRPGEDSRDRLRENVYCPRSGSVISKIIQLPVESVHTSVQNQFTN